VGGIMTASLRFLHHIRLRGGGHILLGSRANRGDTCRRPLFCFFHGDYPMMGHIYKVRHRKPSVSHALNWAKPILSGIHETCLRVPAIGHRDFDRLVDSIMENGLLTPLIVDANMRLLDGRCRLQACYVAGFEPEQLSFEVSTADPEVIAEANIARRHLTPDQKAIMSVEELKKKRTKADVRKRTGGKNRTWQESSELATKPVASKPARQPAALDAVAKESGVSRARLSTAEKIVQRSEKVAKQVSVGNLTLDQAADQLGIGSPKYYPRKQKNTLPLGQTKWLSPHVSAMIQDDGLLTIETPELILCDHDVLDKPWLASFADGAWRLLGPPRDNIQVLSKADAKLQLHNAIKVIIESDGFAKSRGQS